MGGLHIEERLARTGKCGTYIDEQKIMGACRHDVRHIRIILELVKILRSCWLIWLTIVSNEVFL